MTIEELLREAAAKGELNHLSLIPHQKGWSATYCRASTCTHTTAVHADPVEAITRALAEMDFG